MFFNSGADWEQQHIIEALSFELNQCKVDDVKQRTLDNLLINISPKLAHAVGRERRPNRQGQADRALPAGDEGVAGAQHGQAPAGH